jgi:hypothetical protein
MIVFFFAPIASKGGFPLTIAYDRFFVHRSQAKEVALLQLLTIVISGKVDCFVASKGVRRPLTIACATYNAVMWIQNSEGGQ